MSLSPNETYDFGSQKAAANMRDVIERITTGVVNRIRPDVRTGYVHHYNTGSKIAWIMFRGESASNLVRARCGEDRIPTKGYDLYGTDCDIVRVAGKPGDYWIADFVRGIPRVPGIVAGMRMRYAGGITPEGWLEPDGTEVSKELYADLYANIGDAYGSASDPANFLLPTDTPDSHGERALIKF
jgi:hypothetical protein